jgi:hypothetical protein
LINGICVISAEAILKAGTSKEYNKSTLSSSNGVEKQVTDLDLAYSKIKESNSIEREKWS